MVRVWKVTPAWVEGGRAEGGMVLKEETRDDHQREEGMGVTSGCGVVLWPREGGGGVRVVIC